MKNTKVISEDVLKFTKNLIRQYGSNYFLATKMFPKEARQATFVLYGFFRYPDELVDNPGSVVYKKTHQSLDDFLLEWNGVRSNKNELSESHPVIRGFFQVASNYDIAVEYADDFLLAMKQDTWKSSYETYEQLQQYMHGSAVVVGYMMMSVIGYTGEPSGSAKALAEAMQLTNFLRDVSEDYKKRGRIYIPRELMLKHGCTEDMISRGVMTDQLYCLFKEITQRCESLYIQGEEGIKALSKKGRFPVLLASRIYKHHLEQIKKNNYDIFTIKPKVSLARRLIILIRLLIKS